MKTWKRIHIVLYKMPWLTISEVVEATRNWNFRKILRGDGIEFRGDGGKEVDGRYDFIRNTLLNGKRRGTIRRRVGEARGIGRRPHEYALTYYGEGVAERIARRNNPLWLNRTLIAIK